jgi:FKBP-type peptidyl-prolyl cis-trans isomerase FklB
MQAFLLLVLALLCCSVENVWGEKKKGDMNAYLKRSGTKFLDEMSKREGIIKLKSGMLIEIISPSTKTNPKSPTAGDSCEVTYSGTLKDGTKFDAGTTSFAPNQVIKGWTEAMQMMVEGDKWRLFIPYNLAYGERGSPPKIPPYSPLVFEIEIHKVKSGGKSAEKAKEMFEEGKAVEEL